MFFLSLAAEREKNQRERLPAEPPRLKKLPFLLSGINLASLKQYAALNAKSPLFFNASPIRPELTSTYTHNRDGSFN